MPESEDEIIYPEKLIITTASELMKLDEEAVLIQRIDAWIPEKYGYPRHHVSWVAQEEMEPEAHKEAFIAPALTVLKMQVVDEIGVPEDEFIQACKRYVGHYVGMSLASFYP